jgi:hypothetical protein
MVFSNQPFHIHGAPTHLLPVYVADQRLVARVFLAHAASLRHVIFFARMKFRGFPSRLRFKGAGFPSVAAEEQEPPQLNRLVPFPRLST